MMHKELDNVIVESNISIDYFDEIINYIKSNEKEILNLNDDEWTWIAENLMLPKCKKQLYCDEGRGCGLMPSKKEVLNLLKTNNIIKAPATPAMHPSNDLLGLISVNLCFPKCFPIK